MANVITMKKLMEAVRVIQAQNQIVQESLADFHEVLALLDKKGAKPVDLGPLSGPKPVGRTGVCLALDIEEVKKPKNVAE